MSDTVQTRSMVGIVREVTIIVLGILIAFALDAAWDSRQERREERHIVESLRGEFGQTRADLSLWIQFHRKTERNTRVLLAAMDAVAPGSRLEVSDTLIAALLIGPTFDPITATLDALTTAGRLPLIRDPELRGALATWPSRLFDARDEELQARAFLDGYLIPRLAEDAAVLTPSEFVNDWIYGTMPDSLKSRHITLRVSPGLRNLVAVRLWYASGVAEELEGLSATTDHLIALLNELAGSG